MFKFPWGDMHSLNLGWFLQKFNELREDWATAEAGIDGALDAEIQKAEDALSDVFDARDAAAASATAAAGSASAAGTSATAAQNSATAAANSATLANNKATAAGLSEAAAAQSATQAGNSATAAAGSATAAGQSATNAAASETAAGNSATAAATSETNAAASAEYAEESAQRAEDAAAIASASTIVNSVENVSIASVNDALNGNAIELVVGIDPVQTGTGDPAPDNVRPITGWTGANVYRSGADTSNPLIIPISFPASAGTVYGGALDVTAGKLIVNKAKHIVNGTEAQVANQEMNNKVYRTGVSIAEFVPNATGTDAVDIICNIGRGSSRILGGAATVGDCCLFTVGGSACVLIGVPIAYNTVQDARQWLINNNCEFVAKLATPVEITLTETQTLTLLNGINNVWADTGNINLLQYYANSKDYIDAKDALVKALIAKELDDMIADTALTANDFRIVNNTLYRITAPVASGATLTPNTNCTATTIAAVLKTLLS